ncbi:MAG: hypothetical protein JXN63_08145 [Candidatus Delongbacteria bacterium]|nr:hypothetical protein [Candidatus Delongbacteria bacterium]
MNSKSLLSCLIIFTASLFAIESEYLEYDELEALTDYYTSNPLNINTATPSDIYSLPYIDEITAERIYNRIREKGGISTLLTLTDEDILDSEVRNYIEDCIIFEYGEKEASSGEYSLRFKRKLEKSRGYDEYKYMGNPSQFAHKLKFSSRNISVSALAEKEPGEANYSDNLKGNIVYGHKDRFRLILGHFSLNSFSGMLQKEGFVFDQYALKSSSNFHDLTRTAPSTIDYFGYTGASAFYGNKNFRITAFRGRKYISATLNEDGEIQTVNLYAYTRTINEILRYHNSYHEVTGAGAEGKNSVIDYAVSVSDEKFSRQIDNDSKLTEGITGEMSLLKKTGNWTLRGDAATDLDRINLKINSQMRTKDLSADFFYGYVQADKFTLTSPGMMLGSGEEEHVFGAKFRLKPLKKIIIISENIIYFSEQSNSLYPGAVFSIKSSFNAGETAFEPSFRYKSKESADKNFIYSEDREYLARLKMIHKLKAVSVSADMRYADKSDGGYGYLFGSAVYFRKGKYRLRIGGDIYYSKNGAILYASYADTGKYPGLYSFSGTGRKTYIMAGYSHARFEMMAGISRHKTEDGDTSGSGNDLIDSDTVHSAEVNFMINF